MAAHRAPPSLGFSRQEHWSGLPFPSPMHESEKYREVAQSCPTPSDPMDCSLPGPSVHGIFQARVLEWVAIAFSLLNSTCPLKLSYIHILWSLPWGLFSSVQFSRSVMSDSLRPHELQHARPPCPSPIPGVHSWGLLPTADCTLRIAFKFSFVTFLVVSTLVYKEVEIEYCTRETYIMFQENVPSIQNKILESFLFAFPLVYMLNVCWFHSVSTWLEHFEIRDITFMYISVLSLTVLVIVVVHKY